MKRFILYSFFLIILVSCTHKDEDSIQKRNFDLQGTEWESSESRVLKFIDYSVATYRNIGNSYVLNYTQSGNDVEFTISGNSKPDWTGVVNSDGTEFKLNKDEYVIYFKRTK